MKQAGVLPRLKLGERREGENGKESVFPTGPHRVKLLEDKIKKGKDNDGKIIDVVHYIVEEEGVKKFYEVPVKDKTGGLHYLTQRLSEVPEGSEVILEMKKRGIKNYISVLEVNNGTDVEVDEEATVDISDIPPEDNPFPSKVGVNNDIDYPENDLPPSPFDK